MKYKQHSVIGTVYKLVSFLINVKDVFVKLGQVKHATQVQKDKNTKKKTYLTRLTLQEFVTT